MLWLYNKFYLGNGYLDQSKGYYFVYMPKHPKANKKGAIKRAVAIMETKLGRYLEPDEVVHHIDGNKENDKLSNLSIMKSEEHSSLHNAGIPKCRKVDTT